MVEGEGGVVGIIRDSCHHGYVDVIEGGGRQSTPNAKFTLLGAWCGLRVRLTCSWRSEALLLNLTPSSSRAGQGRRTGYFPGSRQGGGFGKLAGAWVGVWW